MSPGHMNGCIAYRTDGKQVHKTASHYNNWQSLVDCQKPCCLQCHVLSSELVHKRVLAMDIEIREVVKLRSNRSTTNEMKREMQISRVPSEGFPQFPRRVCRYCYA